MSDKVEIHVVVENDEGIRLDRWFKNHVPDLKHSQLQKLIRKGNVKLNGKKTKTNVRIEIGDEIRIPPYTEPKPEDKSKPKPPVILSQEQINFIKSMVIYEDDDVFVINKPQDMPVQGGSKVTECIDDLLSGLVKKGEEKPKLVHRLDKDTSGAMIIARNSRSARFLNQAFKSKDVRKYYWAITVGLPELSEGFVDAPLAKTQMYDGERMTVMREADGKYAKTFYAVMEKLGKSAAFVAFWPVTGRTHQIRVHANLMDCPILGDFKYGRENARLDGMEDSINDKMHLHARRLVIPHPSGRQNHFVDITAELPSEMLHSYKTLGFNYNTEIDPFESI